MNGMREFGRDKLLIQQQKLLILFDVVVDVDVDVVVVALSWIIIAV